jgi:hypothetical protein
LTQLRSFLGDIKKDTQESLIKRSNNIAELGHPVAKAVQLLEERKTQGALLLLGQLHSLVNRSKARECFVAGSCGIEDIIELFGIDTGCLTYFSDINHDLARSRMASIKMRPLGAREQGSGPSGVVISVDDRFFRIYAPLLFMYAHHLNQLHFHIVFIGSAEEANRAVELGERYQSLLHDFTGLPSAKKNLSIHHCELPPWVKIPVHSMHVPDFLPCQAY